MTTPANSPVTVKQAAGELGISVRAVQLDVAAGCDGIVSPGKPGRGNGAKVDLEAYRAWRDRAPDIEAIQQHERERAWLLLVEATKSSLRDSAGITRQNRRRSAEFALAVLDRYCQALLRRPLELDAEMRTLFRVLAE